MKKRFTLFATLVGVSLVLAFGTGFSSAKEVPMTGWGSGVITSFVPGPTGVSITAEGSGYATHLGKFTRTETILLDPATGGLTGSIDFIAADGSELHCEFTGGFTGAGTAAGTYTFDGGTGRFENASGEAAFSIVQSDPANFTFEFDGVIDWE
jgi:hypothetical protein